MQNLSLRGKHLHVLWHDLENLIYDRKRSGQSMHELERVFLISKQLNIARVELDRAGEVFKASFPLQFAPMTERESAQDLGIVR